MSQYKPPVENMMHLLFDVLSFSHSEIDRSTAQAVLEEAAKLAADVLAPLNSIGDSFGAQLKDGQVTTAKGFKEVYRQYQEGGWNAVPFDPEYGGQGMPWALAFAIQEMWQGANMSFGLCPLLNQGAVEAIFSHGSEEQKAYYLPSLISGKWTGTMNLTESQAGSDLGLIRTKAQKKEEGSYEISGQKIFITYGDHDMAENIIHLVLARTENAPEDVKGISLFIVPKFLPSGDRNKLSCIGLEHKLGIHASPTCTMDFDGAKGFLVGQENMGLKYMFTMMNNARLSVGLQGVAIAERSLQQAQSYAEQRIQGKSQKTGQRITINHHADVKRMLREMNALVMAGRVMALRAALAMDQAHQGNEEEQMIVEILTPIVKAWCTDMACDVTSIGLQVHGGMGFIEETGAAQFYRDARILPIYEGTNGIQSMDLVFRKLIKDQGKALETLMAKYENQIDKIQREQIHATTKHMLQLAQDQDYDTLGFRATSYLKGLAIIIGAALLSLSDTKVSSVSEDIIDASKYFNTNMRPLASYHLEIARQAM